MSDLSPNVRPDEFNQLAKQTEVWLPLVTKIAQKSQSDGALNRFNEGSNIVFACGSDRVIKIFPDFLKFQYEAEKVALALVYGQVPAATPKLLCSGSLEGWHYIVLSRVAGTPLFAEWNTTSKEEKCALLHDLGKLVSAHHRLPVSGGFPAPAWEEFIPAQMADCVKRHSRLKLPLALLNEIPAYLEDIRSDIPTKLNQPVLLTGEYTPGNILIERSKNHVKISGLIDYGDSMIGFHEYDFLGPCTFLAAGDKNLLMSFFSGYGYGPKDVDQALIRRLMALLLLHRYSNLDVQINLPGWRNVDSLSSLATLIWPVIC